MNIALVDGPSMRDPEDPEESLKFKHVCTNALPTCSHMYVGISVSKEGRVQASLQPKQQRGSPLLLQDMARYSYAYGVSV